MYSEGYVQRNKSHCIPTHTLIYLYPNRIGLSHDHIPYSPYEAGYSIGRQRNRKPGVRTRA
eukprot:4598041-Pleurochrysis_carterae.AAC.1